MGATCHELPNLIKDLQSASGFLRKILDRVDGTKLLRPPPGRGRRGPVGSRFALHTG
jgi:hypothetical protein